MTEPRFEFDARKSKINEERHGIDFVTAQILWIARHLIVPAKDVRGEARSMILARIGARCYAAVFTLRDGVIRIITCHRADRRLEARYEREVEENEEQG